MFEFDLHSGERRPLRVQLPPSSTQSTSSNYVSVHFIRIEKYQFVSDSHTYSSYNKIKLEKERNKAVYQRLVEAEKREKKEKKEIKKEK